ncbi:GPR1/FUN34/YaaH family transporter [Streptomyces sp. NPDC001507]|uniref:GPR1/FUN34/YaaH family transporter n=1 Tax=Streptomyces sp. NPDC001507 TaxID=3364579 RepID=UPI0036B4C42D
MIVTLPEGQAHTGTGLCLLPWAVLPFVLTIAAVRTTAALLAAFLSTTVTISVLTVGQFLQSDTLIRVGGGFGFLTAALGLYGAFAGLVNGTWGRDLISDPHLPRPRQTA